MVNKLFRIIKFFLLRLLRINDSAHGIAIGFTAGFLINFIPSFGLGPVLSTISAKLVKGNPVAGFIGGVAFIWAFPFLFYLNLAVGGTLLTIEIIDLKEISGVFAAGKQITEAFILGMMINLVLFGSLSYLLIFTLVKKYRVELLLFIHRKWRL